MLLLDQFEEGRGALWGAAYPMPILVASERGGMSALARAKRGTHFCADLSFSVSSRLRGGLSLVFRLDLLRIRTKRSATRALAACSLCCPVHSLFLSWSGIPSNSIVPCRCISSFAPKHKRDFKSRSRISASEVQNCGTHVIVSEKSPWTTTPGSRPPPCRTPARAWPLVSIVLVILR